MNITFNPSPVNGKIKAISSKSVAHRILICASFANAPTKIQCDTTNKDICATADCLRALGAKIEYTAPYFYVEPITEIQNEAVLECGESASTLRFMLPIISALGVNGRFNMQGRLSERPLSPLYEELTAHGASLSPQGSNPLISSGKLTGNEYHIKGNISSQFISGLIFALTLSGMGGKIIIEGKLESAPYVNMTVDALKIFGAEPEKTEYGYYIRSNSELCSPDELFVEGDWSNAAFPLCMGAIGNGTVCVFGLNTSSHQGDIAILDILRAFGASVTVGKTDVTVSGGKRLTGIRIDASQIPDLVPVIATVASVAEGESVIYGASRLRLKESDRLASVSSMLTGLGAQVKVTDDGLIINGRPRLVGGEVSSFNDHRIAMSAAVASVVCSSSVTICGFECTSKSYPDFLTDIKSLFN